MFPWRERFLAACVSLYFRGVRQPIAVVFPRTSSAAPEEVFEGVRGLSCIRRSGVASKICERTLAPVSALWHGARPLGAAVAQG